MIPDDIVRRVQEAARIEDVVADFVTLRRAGVNLTGLCPFHDDKHDGNFIVRPSTITEQRGGNTYRCFVCEKKGGPVKFLMEAQKMSFPDAIRYLGRKYSIPVDDAPLDWTPPPPRPAPPPLPRLTFKRQTVADSMRAVDDTLFVSYLRNLPWDEARRRRIDEVLHLYCVACCPHGREWVSFWQIDETGTPLTAKYMRYHADGHRVKDRDAAGNRVFAMDWEHAWRARRWQYNPDKWDTTGRALFGCHLLKKFPKAVVNVVESEKTALIMAIANGDYEHQLFLACGGLEWLQLDMMQPLIDQGRTVWLWPDRDGVSKWQELADKLGSDRVKVYTAFFSSLWTPADGDKADAADITIRLLAHPEQVTQKAQKSQNAQPLTDHQVTQITQINTDSCAQPLPSHQGEGQGWGQEPFYDSEDPRVREWRDILRCSHMLKNDITGGDTITANEALRDHPELESLL